MTKEDKELLFIDLCARLPYEVVCLHPCGAGKLESIEKDEYGIEVTFKTPDNNYYDIEQCRPYLRPMSSMSEEEKAELNNILEYQYYADDSCMCEASDWLNAHHFDYRGLIEKGLALEAKEGIYKIGNL